MEKISNNEIQNLRVSFDKTSLSKLNIKIPLFPDEKSGFVSGY